MVETKLTKEKREIPFDLPIKITLLFFHFVGFSGWYGGIIIGAEVPGIFIALATGSGILLVVRELYKDGFIWLIVTEGALNIFKVVILLLMGMLKRYEGFLFILIMLCGLLSSHLPKEIREKRIL